MRLVTLALALVLVGAAPAPDNFASFAWFDYRGGDPSDALPRRPGDYRNPVLHGFYPDPSVTRVGDTFYLVTSTFSWFPGIPVFRSRDLVHWTQIGNAIDRPSQLDFKRLGMSRGVFAPSIHEHRGIFYILNTCVECGGNYVISARDPAGPWSDPVWLPDLAGGIDPSFFFDEDGSAWIVNNDVPPGKPLYDGHRALWLQQFDLRTMKTFGPRTMLVNGGVDLAKKPVWIEGPHIFRKDGFYYLTAAEGGTAEGHSEVVLRSKALAGPYVPFAGNPILTQRDLPRDRAMPITSAGHAELVEAPNGDWWATFLAVRPYEGDYYNTGRETFALPVRWENGWPRITDPGQTIPYVHRRPALPPQPAGPVPTAGAFAIRDEFDGAKLPPYWMMMRNPRETWWSLAGGALRLRPRPVALGDNGNPSFVARRQQHMNATASTELSYCPRGDGDEAGIAALQNDAAWYLLAVTRQSGKPMLVLKRRASESEPAGGIVIASAPLPVACGAPVRLRIAARGGAYDFLYAGARGQWRMLEQGADGKLLSTRQAGGFVGAMLGLYAHSGGN